MAFELRPDWLESVREEILEPDRVIVDPHHHFFVETEFFPHYRLADLWADTDTHGVAKTVFLQCGECYRTSGPEALRPVGETEWVARIAAEAAEAPGRAQIAAIVGTADLMLGAQVRDVLEAHLEASALFRGIRQVAVWDG